MHMRRDRSIFSATSGGEEIFVLSAGRVTVCVSVVSCLQRGVFSVSVHMQHALWEDSSAELGFVVLSLNK